MYWFLLSLATVALSGKCPCELEIDDAGKVDYLLYLQRFAEKKLEKCCPNYGPMFSSWGEQCPESFEEISRQIKQGPMVEADGGKSGQTVLIADNFVIKESGPDEKKSLDRVLAKLSRSNGRKNSLIAPICRVISVTHPGGFRYVTISLNMQIKNSHIFGEAFFLDLKGNYGNKARDTDPLAKTKKDGDFWRTFPSGVHITDTRLREEMREKIVDDTKMLHELGHMDYSLMLHMVEWCERPIQTCAAQYSVDVPSAMPGPSGESFKSGKFRKTCVKLDAGHEARPVYANDKKEFMYYRHGAWRIGKDFHSNDATLFLKGDLPCPGAGVWGRRAGEKTEKVSLHVRSEDVQLDFQSRAAMNRANPHVPLAFATASTKEGIKTFGVSYALIDVAQWEKKKGPIYKHYGTELKKYLTAATCSQDDVSQLDSTPYRARFLMMWSHRLTESCLAKNAYFTYFPHTDKLLAMVDCPQGETACKSLCKHLGLAEPDEPNGQCSAVKAMLNSCKHILNRAGLGGFWASSQKQIEVLLSKNIYPSQVMHFVSELYKELKVMDEGKVKKYADCHVAIRQALETFEEAQAATHNGQACKIEDKGKGQSCR